uniref:Uncharacterized protein n=1 Tax=Anser brachyrhynchus TaxID=132585 RepID=A0A8B9CFZ4_9AVES
HLRRLWFLCTLKVCRSAADGPIPTLIIELVVTNNEVVLKNITEDLQNLPHLPTEAMFNLEHIAMQKPPERTQNYRTSAFIHCPWFMLMHSFMMMIIVDSLCEEERMNRNYCTECGSYKSASLEFISHSFSLMKLKFLYQHVLPDLTGKVVVDIGSRLGAELFVGYLYSSASQLYGLIDRIKVVHADICTQASLLQLEQARAWEFIACNVKKRGSLLVTVPNLEDLLSKLRTDIQFSQWVVEVQLNYDVNVEKDIDKEALEQIYLYSIL